MCKTNYAIRIKENLEPQIVPIVKVKKKNHMYQKHKDNMRLIMVEW